MTCSTSDTIHTCWFCPFYTCVMLNNTTSNLVFEFSIDLPETATINAFISFTWRQCFKCRQKSLQAECSMQLLTSLIKYTRVTTDLQRTVYFLSASDYVLNYLPSMCAQRASLSCKWNPVVVVLLRTTIDISNSNLQQIRIVSLAAREKTWQTGVYGSAVSQAFQ